MTKQVAVKKAIDILSGNDAVSVSECLEIVKQLKKIDRDFDIKAGRG